jgi:hypothetical protein
VIGDELGEVLEQVGWTADAVFPAQAVMVEVADGRVEGGTDGVHDDSGMPVDQFGDHDAVATR